jgi:hypothetical protein
MCISTVCYILSAAATRESCAGSRPTANTDMDIRADALSSAPTKCGSGSPASKCDHVMTPPRLARGRPQRSIQGPYPFADVTVLFS